MIVDSSALLAILLKEPDRSRLGDAIAMVRRRRVSAVTLFETAMVMEARHGEQGAAALDSLVTELRLQIVPFTAEHVALAREAFRRYERGGGHPAQLNFGDCMAYALAKATGEPLLFKCNDFAQTDIEAVVY